MCNQSDVARMLPKIQMENRLFIIIFVKTFEVKGHSALKMTHFAGETWNGNHLPNSGAVYNPEVPFPQIWNQEGAAAYSEIIGFQDLGENRLFSDQSRNHEKKILSFSNLASQPGRKFRVATTLLAQNRTDTIQFFVESLDKCGDEENPPPSCINGSKESRKYSRAKANVQSERG